MHNRTHLPLKNYVITTKELEGTMRLLNKLFAQHLGWQFKKHWQVQGKRIPRDTGASADLSKFGVHIKDAADVVKEYPQTYERITINNDENAYVEDGTHPNWHEQPCFIYGDKNVLLEGMPQAKVLTNTIEINKFPKNIEDYLNKLQIPQSADRNIENAIMSSFVFDAEQVKLPKCSLPDRPAFTLPRSYGISHDRRITLLLNKLMFECEKIAGRSVNSQRKVFDNADFKVTLAKDDSLVQFIGNSQKLITVGRSIEPVKNKYQEDLPDLYPLKCTISMPKTNIYSTETHFPLSEKKTCNVPHTVFLNFNKENVCNLHGTSVTPSQFQSRTLLHAFTVATAFAKLRYGENTMPNLAKPVLVQSVQTDGRSFHFGIFQLNTLDIGTDGSEQNYWFHVPVIDLFSDCGYHLGRPLLNGYNKQVFRLLCAFYNNM